MGYAISLDGHNYDSDIFDSYDEALVEGLDRSIGDFYIAEIEEFKPDLTNIGDQVLDILYDNACDECGESAEDWFCDLKDSEVKEFNNKLNEVLSEFVKNHQTFQLYTIKNPELIERTD